MSLNLDRALTGKRISKSTVSDIICDPDICFILNNVSPNSASKTHPLKPSAEKYLLTTLTYECVEANSVDPDQEQSDWVHTVTVCL